MNNRLKTSSWPARLTFSFLKTDVSKSSEVKGLIAGTDTMRAPRAEPSALAPLTPTALRAFDPMEEDDDKNPKLAGAGGLRAAFFRVLDDEAEIAGEKDVAAAIDESARSGDEQQSGDYRVLIGPEAAHSNDRKSRVKYPPSTCQLYVS